MSRYTADTLALVKARNPRRRLRLDHGRRQSARLPPLAALAADRADLPDRRHRPAGLDACPFCLRSWRRPSTMPASTKAMRRALRACRRRPGPSSTGRARRSRPPRIRRSESASPLIQRRQFADPAAPRPVMSLLPLRAARADVHFRPRWPTTLRQAARTVEPRTPRRADAGDRQHHRCRWRWWRSATG